MEASTVNLLTLMFSAVGGAVGAYVAIRIRLAAIEARQERDREHFVERIAHAQATAQRAHERIDTLLHHHGGTKWPADST